MMRMAGMLLTLGMVVVFAGFGVIMGWILGHGVEDDI